MRTPLSHLFSWTVVTCALLMSPSCGGGGGGGTTPPALCRTSDQAPAAKRCAVIEDTGPRCCDAFGSGDGFHLNITNLHPTRALRAVVLEESRPDVNANWSATTATLIPLAATQTLPLTSPGQICPMQQFGPIEFPRCGEVRRFTVTQACYTDDPACAPAFPKPSDVPPTFSCALACANNEITCNTVLFASISSTQQAGIADLRKLMQTSTLPQSFDLTTVVQALTGFSCPNPRSMDIAASGSVVSVGAQCDVAIPSLGMRYPDPSIDITSVDAHFSHTITGSLSRSTYGASLVFNVATPQCPDVMAQREQGGTVIPPVNDLIQTVDIVGLDGQIGSLIVAGRYFMCMRVSDIPPTEN